MVFKKGIRTFRLNYVLLLKISKSTKWTDPLRVKILSTPQKWTDSLECEKFWSTKWTDPLEDENFSKSIEWIDPLEGENLINSTKVDGPTRG